MYCRTTAVTRPGSTARDRSRMGFSSTRFSPRPYRVKVTDRCSTDKIGSIASSYSWALAGVSSSRSRSPATANSITTSTSDSPGNRASHQRPAAR